ncbi:MAG: sigma 54-interacting transcriptional regulator [Planctomyces sp.]|nr:sigma 54-interacting transcriptional regulator [Planctomyces sp.]
MRPPTAAFITIYGQTRPLSSNRPTTIGRGAENEIVLPEPECSRKHCEIAFRDGRWVIRDYDSRNGTFVNDRPITGEYPLQSGDVIRIALVKIKFRMVYSGDTASSFPAFSDEAPRHSSPVASVATPSDSGSWSSPARESLPPILGESPVTQDLREQVIRLGALNAPVLITGPNGVGKGVVALHVHHASGRPSTSFVYWDCNSVSSNTSLAESSRIGTLQMPQAEGTLFLDEIAVLPSIDQSFLLSLLLQLESLPDEPGARRPRVLASTSVNLEEAVESGKFRRDLYFRLNVLTVQIRPLVERKPDILPLADHFRSRYARQLGRAIEGFSSSAIAALESHSWPGNVRELENTVYRAVALCGTSTIDADDLHLTVKATGERGAVIAPPYQGRSLEDIELAHILATLNETEWNKTRAAGILGIERSTLDRKLKRYGLNRPPASMRTPLRESPDPSST